MEQGLVGDRALRVAAAEAEKDQARADAARAAETARLTGQETVAARAAASAGEETHRVRDDAGKTLAGFRAEAAELAVVRADLRAKRAERVG